MKKSQRRLLLLQGAEIVASYAIALGQEPGRKERQGDRRTPEGRYLIDGRKLDSQYYRALRISYPNAEDRRRARSAGLKPGGDIMIHGLPNGLEGIGSYHSSGDWTRGCIAVTNEELDEIWARVPDGTPIEILP